MITFERPKERVVGVGEHIEGIGVVLDPDGFLNYVEAIYRQTVDFDELRKKAGMEVDA